jgi:alanyl-tRNA synthetase
MNSNELRSKFLHFFKEKGHKVIPSASLVPANDPTVLFTTAGMHPLVPFLLGEKHPAGKRLVNYQKCLRTDDIDEVGDETHNTFFEMLGNWSLGDYWKDDSIKWSYEFLTDPNWLGLAKERLAVSVFAGDNDAPKDEESAAIWKSLGISGERIAYLGKKDNWWGPPGATGPCGPDTEIFYWTGKSDAPEKFDPENKKWVEIWNNVFMQYEKTADGKFEPLKQKNVDTGMGLERMTSILENQQSVYDTELFAPLIAHIRSIASKQDTRGERIIADHIRAAVFLIADGVTPSNKDRGYILRRLIRRAVTYGQKIGIDHDFTAELCELIVPEYEDIYPELRNSPAERELKAEEIKFRTTLGEGIKKIEKLASSLVNEDELAKLVFDLYQTEGMPFELTLETLKNYGYHESDLAGLKKKVQELVKNHQELSRTASAGQFKGGLASHSDKTVRLHTATHLLNAALRKVLGENVWQKGSNITEERTRFDFTNDKKMTDEEKKEVERLVNDWINLDLTVKKETMPLDEARKLGAIGVFGEKYPDTVSIYTIFDPSTGIVVSREFCGGPHVEHTGVIGKFKIQKEEAVSAGVRRIKAVIE